MTLQVAISARLADLRRSSGLSLRAVERRADVPMMTVHYYERHATRRHSVEILYKIVGAYGLTLSEFFADTEAVE